MERFNNSYFLSGLLVFLGSVGLFIWQFSLKNDMLSIQEYNTSVQADIYLKEEEKSNKGQSKYRMYFEYERDGEILSASSLVTEESYNKLNQGDKATILLHPTDPGKVSCEFCTEYSDVLNGVTVIALSVFAFGGIFSMYLGMKKTVATT